MHEDISSLIHEYHELIPEKLPNGLPLSRGRHFSIEPMPDAKPQPRGIYRMSLPELEEVRKKLTKPVDQGFISPSSNPWAGPVLLLSKRTESPASVWINEL